MISSVMNRRSVFTGFATTYACCVCNKSLAQTPRKYIQSGAADRIQCGNEPGGDRSFVPTASLVVDQTGFAELDQNIDEEQKALNLTYAFISRDGSKDYGRPILKFYKDGQKPISARAIRLRDDRAAVYIGTTFIKNEIAHNPQTWREILIGTLAHEWAHAYQYRSGLDERLFIWETHADYLAGWYIGIKNSVFRLDVNIDNFCSALSKRGGPTDKFDPDAYGSPELRTRAAKEGYKYALQHSNRASRPDISEAAAAAYDFVSAAVPRR